MRQLLLPFYRPLYPSPERAVLSLLHAAVRVAEQSKPSANDGLVLSLKL